MARSLVLEPAVLLFDEPLSNLDAKLRRRVRQEIRDLQQALELTVIYVTHDQEEALAVSDHIIVMESGRIAQKGTPHELYESPASRFLADFIGDANLVDGELVAATEAARSLPAAPACRCAPTASRPAPATLAVRPNRLRLTHAGAGHRAGRVQARRLPRQPHRVHGGHAVGRAARVRRRAKRRAAARHRRSAWRSTRTP